MCQDIKDRDCQGLEGFYNSRYAHGYMEEWPSDKKNRVFELIKSLNLSSSGDFLDYGCGNGVFTDIIKQALPGWNAYGVDISSIAIENAKRKYPKHQFFLVPELLLKNIKFDLIFSHHLFEHVDDIDKIWHEMDVYLKKKANSLHILPCGNSGSLEYKICLLRKDGINKGLGNRFFFEDESHLRRFTTEDMNKFANQYGLKLVFDYYSNCFYGAVDWITLSSYPFIFNMMNPMKARNTYSAIKLLFLGLSLSVIKMLRFPANTIDYKKYKMSKIKYSLLLMVLLLFYPFSKLVNIYLKFMSDREWERGKRKKDGSEMYMYYQRQ